MNSPGLKIGLISAAISVTLSAILYYVDPRLKYGDFAVLPQLIIIGLAFFAGVWERSVNGGYISFGRVLGAIFAVFVITEVSYSLFEFVLHNYIDSEAPAVMKEVKIDNTIKWAERYKSIGIQMSEEEYKNQLDIVTNKIDYRFRLSNALQAILVWCLIDLVFALILAAILRREPK